MLGSFSQVLRMSRSRVLADFSGQSDTQTMPCSLVTTTNGKVLSDIHVLVTVNSHSEPSVPMAEEGRHWFCSAPAATEACSPSAAGQHRVATTWEKAAWRRRCHSGLSVLWPGT